MLCRAVQVLLRWGLQQDCAVIPKSVHPDRIKAASPACLMGWELSAQDMAELDALEDGTKYCWDASRIL
jgi:diketogulonate reductase-like aldo/keto reductase